MLLPLSLLALAQVPQPPLPKPFDTKSVTKHPKVVGWPDGKTPKAPPEFTVTEYAKGFDNPRWLYVLPNGDVLLADSRSQPAKKPKPGDKPTAGPGNKLWLLRDADHDGKSEVKELFLDGLNQPFGMALIGDTLFVANTDGVLAYPYKAGETKITAQGKKILDLPAGGYNNHWTRNLLASKDGKKLYVSVGSGSNVAERGLDHEKGRACIHEVNPDGTGLRTFGAGLRNPVGMAWEPASGKLWTAVNERDGLGDDLPPDYMTSVQDGAFYGWPFAYTGANEDPRRKGERPDLVAKTLVPDVLLGSHTASLGLCFYTGDKLPEKYRGGAFVGQRGSWNRSSFVGYKVVFVPFKDGKPSGPPEDFLTGFLANDTDAHGRPVCVAVAADGALLVTDDAGNRVWRVAAK